MLNVENFWKVNFKAGVKKTNSIKCFFLNGDRKTKKVALFSYFECIFRGYSIRDRYTVRPNTSYLEEVYHGHWDQIKRDEDEVEKVMDMRWDEYVDMFGFTPAEYIDSPQYKAKYGENQVIFSFYM